MGLLSAAMLAELRKQTPEVYFVLEVDDGDGGTLRLSAENIGSRTRGLYLNLISKWGKYTRTLSNFRSGLQAARLSVDLDNTGGAIVRTYGRVWKGRTARGLLMSPNVEAADYCTWFVGVVDDTPREGSTLTLEMRQDDDALTAKVPKAPIKNNTFPGLPAKGDANGKAQPYVVGTLDSTGIGALGLVPALYVSGTQFTYLVSVGWWQNVVRVYADNVLKTLGDVTIGGDYTLELALSGDGRKHVRIKFNADQGAAAIVCDVQDSSTPEGPGATLAQVLSDLVYGDYHTEHPDATDHPINTAALALLDSGFLVPLRLGRGYYVPGTRTDGKTIIKHFCDSYEVHALWGIDGKLSVVPWDNRTQGNQIYLGPGAPGTDERAQEVITPDVILSQQFKFSRDPESAINSLLVRAGLRPSDGSWLNQRTCANRLPSDKLKADEQELPFLPPASASVGSQANLQPVGTSANVGWAPVGAGSLHAAVAQDPNVPASSSQYMRATGAASVRFALSAMPDLTAVQSVAIYVEILADGTVLSGDDDVLVGSLYVSGSTYGGSSPVVGGGVFGDAASGGYRRHLLGEWPTNLFTTLQWTQADLNALEAIIEWIPNTTAGSVPPKVMQVRLVFVPVAYTASAEVQPAHVNVPSRRMIHYEKPPESISVDLPLRFMDVDLGGLVAYADAREGWPNTVAGRQLARRTGWALDPNTKRFTPTDEDISRQLSTLWIYCKASIGVDGSSAVGDGVIFLTHGAQVNCVRGSTKQMDAPAGEDVQECGPSVKVLVNTLPSDRYGTLIEPQSTNLLKNSAFKLDDAGSPPLPLNWTLASGVGALDRTVGEQLFLDEAVTLQSYVLTGNGATASVLTADQTGDIAANSSVFVSLARKGSSATAGDGAYLRAQRSVDSKYWRASDRTWQAAVTDNAFPAVTSYSRWDAIEKIDVGASITKLTLSWVLPVAGTVGRTVRVGHSQIEVGTQATSMIPTEGAVVTRAADEIRISNDEDTGDYELVPFDHGCIKSRVRVMFNDADIEASGRRYLWRKSFDANNRAALYYLKATGWRLEVVAGGVTHTATVQSTDRAPLREDIVTVGARWTSNDSTGELDKAAGTWSVVLKDHDGDVSSTDVTVGAPPTFAAGAQFEWGYDASTAGRQFNGYFEEVRQSPLCFEDEELVS